MIEYILIGLSLILSINAIILIRLIKNETDEKLQQIIRHIPRLEDIDTMQDAILQKMIFLEGNVDSISKEIIIQRHFSEKLHSVEMKDNLTSREQDKN